jgi:hypothetical protein
MRKELFLASFTCVAALSVPGLAWAEPDCGNLPVQTAEIVYTIQTPEAALAPDVQTSEPAQIAVQPQTVESAEPQITKTAEAHSEAPKEAAETNDVVANYSAVLERRISRGADALNLFDYAGAKAAGEMKVIKAYTDYLASQNPDSLSEADQIAYWANLYNALTVNLILENYPVKSIRKIKAGAFSTGPWKRDEVTVNGKVLSLDDIEHKILRKRYPNPALVHYMVNCASIGCPNLQPKLWNGATLDADRDAAAREFINSSRGVAINGKKLKVSSIYNWFKEDFGGSKSETLKHFRQYAGPELLSALDTGAEIDDYGYDWDLNE